jgi:hypothetical protein
LPHQLAEQEQISAAPAASDATRSACSAIAIQQKYRPSTSLPPR